MPEFFDDRAQQHAAAISYYALFSIFPLAILAVAVFGLVASDETVRDTTIDFLLDNLPLERGQGRAELREALEGVTDNPGAGGAVGLAGLVFAGAGLMGAVRTALNAAWDVADGGRPPLQGKLLDVLLVFGSGLVIALSFALTILNQVAAAAAEEIEEAVGGLGGVLVTIVLELGQLSPLAVSFALFAFLYRVVPAVDTRLRDLWPGALVAAIGYELAKIGFSFYIDNLRDFSAVYGSLGAVVAFLVFVFLAASVFLLGAEIASEWPRVRDGADEDGDERPLGERIRGFLRGLVVSERDG